jgi:hypothetical protein
MTGMAGGVGSRARRSVSTRAQQAIEDVSLNLSQQKEQADEAIRNADIERGQSMNAASLAMQTAKDSSELSMNQTRSGLEREKENKMAELVTEKSKVLDRLRADAQSIKTATINAFTNTDSDWNPADRAHYNVPGYFDTLDKKWEWDDEA